MKNVKFLAILILAFVANLSFAQVNPNYTYVKSYYTKSGTHVNGYYRTTPNSTINDNYSTWPNVNPWTGKQGTISPDYSYPQYTTPKYDRQEYNYYSQPTYTVPSYNLNDYQLPSLPSLNTYSIFSDDDD